MNWTTHKRGHRTWYMASTSYGPVSVKQATTGSGAVVWRAMFPDGRHAGCMTADAAKAYIEANLERMFNP